MTRTQQLLWALTTYALLCGVARADTVFGKVVDSNNAPVVGAKVFFTNVTSPFVTNALGIFAAVVATGTYDIRIIPPTTSLAPVQFLGVQVLVSKDIGTVVLKPGFVVTGKVIDAASNPIALANLDFIDESTLTEIFTSKDGTDVFGNVTTVVPAATYTIHVRPPSNTQLVTTTLRGVVIAAAKNLGNITLHSGALISGTVVDSVTKLPIANVDIDAEGRFGRNILLSNDRTSSTGTFAVLLPLELLHLTFDAPRSTNHVGLELLNLTITGSTNLGTIEMVKGFTLSGQVLGSSSNPVRNADIDIDTAVGDVRIFTPHDNTDSSGFFSVVVPSGNYRVTVEPEKSNLLVGTVTNAIAVSANTVVPTITLSPGVLLSGVVNGHDGKPEVDVDLDVLHPTTGVELVTPHDDTDASGRYSIVVPTGTWNVRFQSGKTSLSRVKTVANVSVLGATTLNQSLALVPIGAYFGTRGLPTIANGAPVVAILAFLNPTTQIQQTRASIVFSDPLRKETTILGPLLLPVPSGFSYVSVFLMPTLPINQTLLGLQCRLSARFDDPTNGSEQDHSTFKFFVK